MPWIEIPQLACGNTPPLSQKQIAQRLRDQCLRDVLETLEVEDKGTPRPYLEKLSTIWVQKF